MMSGAPSSQSRLESIAGWVHNHKLTTFSLLEIASTGVAAYFGVQTASQVGGDFNAAFEASKISFGVRMLAGTALLPLYFWANSDLYSGESFMKGAIHRLRDGVKLTAINQGINVLTFPLSVGIYTAANFVFPHVVGQVLSGKPLIPVTYAAKVKLYGRFMLKDLPEEPPEYAYFRRIRHSTWQGLKTYAAAAKVSLQAFLSMSK